jgi:GT2 family glycosyltransferase
MKVSICVPTYNVCELTKQCLASLLPTCGDLVEEIIVIDNCSTDGTRDYLKTLSAPFKVVLNKENRGFAYSNNVAARMAKGDVFCMLNADTVLRPRWIEPMLKVFKERKDAGFVGNIQWSPKLKAYDHMGMVITRELTTTHFGRYWKFIPFRGYGDWTCVTAACAMIRRDLFLEMGGFDEIYVSGGYEDTDLCFQLNAKGYKNYVSYDSVIDHYVSSSPGISVNTKKNQEIFNSRWKDALLAARTKREIRRSGINYLVRAWPWILQSLADVVGVGAKTSETAVV